MNMPANILANLASVDNVEDEKDIIGGGGVVDSGLYETTVELAYLEKAKSGALGLNLRLKTSNGRSIRQTLWMTSGNDKGNKNYYEKDGERRYLPGFNLAQSLCLLTVGKEIGEVAAAAENKIVKIYSYDAKEEVPTEVPVLVDLLNQPIVAAVVKQIVDKNRKNEATGVYEPTGETREENDIEKFFRAKDRMTTAEIRAGQTEATFANTWAEKWTGQVKDRTTKLAGKAGAPKAATANKKPTASLFG
jgi:hypothetical protein